MRPTGVHRRPGRGTRAPLLTALLPLLSAGLFVALDLARPLAARPLPDPELPLVDRTSAAGLDFVHFNGMSGELYFVEMMGGGVALLDYDGDGDLDIYLVQGEMLGEAPLSTAVFPPADDPPSDRLLRNDLAVDADGEIDVVLTDVTERAGIPPGGYGMGVATGDYDGDGWTDLYVTQFGSNRLLRNQGDGTFHDATTVSGADDARWSVAASFLDYDGDGRLDLYVGNYVDYRLATHRPCYSDTGVLDYCGPGAFPPVSDSLFRNLGDGRFEDVSHRSGLGAEAGAGLGSIANDWNGDGRMDLYVANDGDRNHLWLNQGDGTFVDEALLAGTAVSADGQPEASMGVAVGDIDGDGLDDLFMTHLTGETNTLYLNQGGLMFSDGSNDSGLGLASWQQTGFGVSLSDFDLDGRLDVYVANGAVKRLEEQLVAGDPLPLRQPDQYFANRGEGRFVEVTGHPVEETMEVGRGVATGDLDEDGDPDVVVINNSGPAWLLATRGVAGREFVGARMRTAAGAPAIGARAYLVSPDGARRGRRVATDGSYASAGDARALWGLRGMRSESSAGASAPESVTSEPVASDLALRERDLTLELRWPSGRRLVLTGPPAGRYLVFDDRSPEATAP